MWCKVGLEVTVQATNCCIEQLCGLLKKTKHCPNVMFIDHEYEPVPNVVHVGESSNKQMYITYARNYVIL